MSDQQDHRFRQEQPEGTAYNNGKQKHLHTFLQPDNTYTYDKDLQHIHQMYTLNYISNIIKMLFRWKWVMTFNITNYELGDSGLGQNISNNLSTNKPIQKLICSLCSN